MSATITMSAYLAAILGTLRAHPWPAPLAQIGFREPESFDPDEPETVIRTPALLLNLVERRSATAEPSAVTTRRVARRCTLELHCLLSTATRDVAVELLEYTEAVFALLEAPDPPGSRKRGQRWGLADAVDRPTDLADIDAAMMRDAAGLPAWPGFAARVIQFSQAVYLPEA